MEGLSPNFSYILFNTPLSYPLCITEKEALKYLNLIYQPNFLYNNVNCYDIIDYQKLIFLEVHFKNNSEIQEKISLIKDAIAEGYRIQNQYRNRILDMPNIPIPEEDWEKGFYGIPRSIK